MVPRMRRDIASLWLAWLAAMLLLAGCATPAQLADPLPSWNEGPAKAAIIKLVQDTTWPGSLEFVPLPERIATFDNDGTLWCEHPMYVEALFTFERLREMGKSNPPWRNERPYKGVVDNDMAAMTSLTGPEYFQIAAMTHAGFTPAEPRQRVAVEQRRPQEFPRVGKLDEREERDRLQVDALGAQPGRHQVEQQVEGKARAEPRHDADQHPAVEQRLPPRLAACVRFGCHGNYCPGSSNGKTTFQSDFMLSNCQFRAGAASSPALSRPTCVSRS